MNFKSSHDDFEFSIRKKITIIILNKFEELVPVILFVSSMGVLFMIQYAISDYGLVSSRLILNKFNSCKDNPIILIAKLSISEKFSKVPELGHRLFLSDVNLLGCCRKVYENI